MESRTERGRGSLRGVIVSAAIHGAFFVCVFVFGVHAPVVMVKSVHPQRVADLAYAGGSHRIRIVLPAAETSAHVKDPDAHVEASKKTAIPMRVPEQSKSGGGSTKDPHHGDGTGKAMRGNGADRIDMTPAFPVYSPHPPIHDRALLPQTAEKIVIDVDLDEAGLVVKETLVKGLGNQLDAMVLGIVKTWKFQPAKIDGKPVASQAEVVFPLDRNYPVA
ncbi:energy transducer TonB [Occallatibacter savannae]|uniref:energy transducer TonB n=1 Tax=Occallatibacter savannae TaxID=1002691 RepID=UPI000D69B731|nr:energy transducer TonB [Occallatibacter savannae]